MKTEASCNCGAAGCPIDDQGPTPRIVNSAPLDGVEPSSLLCRCEKGSGCRQHIRPTCPAKALADHRNDLERFAATNYAKASAANRKAREESASQTVAGKAQQIAAMASAGAIRDASVYGEGMHRTIYRAAGVVSQDNPASFVVGTGLAQGTTEKTFTRAEVLAVLKAQHVLALDEAATGEWRAAKNSAFRELATIFERME